MIGDKLEKIFRNSPERELNLLSRAAAIASKSLEGIKRDDGNPFMNHVLSVAEIVASEITLPLPAVCAVFLHEAFRVNRDGLKELKSQFGDEIINMVESLNRISEIKPKETGLQAENFRKLIVSYSKDPRVTLIKLADRLEVMRSLDNFPKTKQVKKSTETQFLYAPLAHQLGLYNMKSEMEDIAFRFTDPENYRLVANKLKAGEQERKRLTDLFVKPVELALKKAHIKYRLKSRTKTAYSIWKKMQKQQISFEQVADLFAIRVILDSHQESEKELCWRVYSIITEFYTPDTKRLRDWITVPKENGYESLHTTVTGPQGSIIEVQIRSERMDEIAESGHASHWSYKGVKGVSGLDSWLEGVKKLLESPEKSNPDMMDISEMDEIFVFTPSGDLRRLLKGSSVLDFAFDIHTNLGLKCSGAKVNGKPCSIREGLKTGDVVEIISNKNQKPSLDWLNFVVSSKARSKIKLKVREEESKTADSGRELFERRMNNWKIVADDDLLAFLIKHYKHKSIFDFFAALGSGSVDIAEVKSLIQTRGEDSNQKEVQDLSEVKTTQSHTSAGDYLIIDERLNNIDFKLAKCCNPIKGDDVFGFVTIKEGIKIHRITCPNASRLMENYPYRVQKARWRESSASNSFQAAIRISAYEEGGLGRQIMDLVSGFNIPLRHFSISGNKGMVEAKLQISVPNNQMLDKIIFNLKKLKGVKTVSRISNV
ncbi:MAG: RelA/SpoT family protein [Bacteroidales bacterium]|jgi:GTP pyrophosphokinase|nr:RelA/SpoT family protein [Bacteroidales bacterium]